MTPMRRAVTALLTGRFMTFHPRLAVFEKTLPRAAQLADAGMQGRNDSGDFGYTGPCPPSGRHRYFARLYALREKLGLPAGATAAEVQTALDGKVIEQAELMATYQKVRTG